MDKLKSQLIQKTKIFFTLSSILLVVFVSLYGFVFRQIKSININNAKISEKIETNFEEFLVISGQQRAISTTIVEREKLDSYFLDQDSVAGFFAKLEELGSIAGVELSISSARVDYDVDQLKIQVTTSGSFEDVYQFFLLLETVQFGINITRSDIRRVDLEGVPPWQGTFDIVILSYETTL